MRGILLSLAFAGIMAAAAPATSFASALTAAPTISASAPVYALQVPDKKIEITVGDRSGGVRWYRSPVWIAIGAIAVVIVLLLVILAVRGGGGTTVIRQ
jgi:hypothetical protein